MDQNGIFFTIVLTKDSGDQCLQHGLRGATIERDHNLVADGSAATLHVLSAQGASMMVLNVRRNGYCYQFDLVSWAPSVRDAHENIALLMLSSIRFGSAPQPVS
jgi:hypothetical protein